MRQVFTHQNNAIAGSIRNYLESHGVNCQLRNEYSSNVMGEVGFTTVWPEVWVSDVDFAKAKLLLEQIHPSNSGGADWKCRQCQEVNPASFETCWLCSEVSMWAKTD